MTENEKIIPEPDKAQMERQFERLLADKLKIKSLASILRELPDEEDKLPDVRRWL